MSISSTFFARVFRTKRRFGSFFLDTTSTNVAAEMTFVRKIRTFNVDEIDGKIIILFFAILPTTSDGFEVEV